MTTKAKSLEREGEMDVEQLYREIEEKRMEIARTIFSPQAVPYPARNAKHVLRIAGELVQLCALMKDRATGGWGDK